jgi:hypothetical protein
VPYIEQQRRVDLRRGSKVTDRYAQTSGELNYVLTYIVADFLKRKGLSYQTCNDIVGALDNCKDEFKRRIQNPYEDTKILTNGDVY